MSYRRRRSSDKTANENYSHQQQTYSPRPIFDTGHQPSTAAISHLRKNEDMRMSGIQSRSSSSSEYRQVQAAASKIPVDHLKIIINERDKEIAELNEKWENENNNIAYIQRQNDNLVRRLNDFKLNTTTRLAELHRSNNKQTLTINNLNQKLRRYENELRDAQTKLRKRQEELDTERSKAYSKHQYEDEFETGGNNPFITQSAGHFRIAYKDEFPRCSANEYNSLKDQYHELEFNFTNKKQELETMRISLRKTHEDVRNAKAEQVVYKQQLNDTISELTEEKNRLDTCYRSLQRQNEDLKQDKYSLQNKVRRSEKRLKEVNMELEGTKMSFQQHTTTNSIAMDSHVKLVQVQSELRRKEIDSKEVEEKLEETKTIMQRQIDNSKTLEASKIAKLEQEKRDLETCVSDLERQNKDMQSTITLQNTSLESVHRDDEYNAMLSKLHRTEMEFEEAEKEKKILKTHVAEVEKQNNKMKDSITKLTTQLESTRKTSVSSTDYNILESKLRNTETELREAKQELAATRTRLQEQTTFADNLGNSKLAKLEQERHDLEISAANLKRKNDTFKNDINQLTSRLESVQKRVDDYDDMKRKLLHTEIKLKESDLEKENLKVHVSDLEQQKNKVTDRANQLTTQFESIRKTSVSSADYNALKSLLQHSDTALREADRELAVMRTRLQEQMTYADTLGNSKLSKLEKEKRELKRENDEINNDKIQLTNRLESIQKVMNDYNGMQSRLDRTEKDLRETDQVKRELEVCVADLEHQNADMKDSITQLTTQLESNRKASVTFDDYDVLQSKLRHTEMELSKVELELDNTKTRLHTLTDKDVCINNEIATLRTRLANLEKELQQKNHEVKKYKQEISGVQQTKQDKDKRVDALCKERDTLKQKLNERDYIEKELRSTIAKQQQQMDSSTSDHKTEIAKLNQQRHVIETYVTKLTQENNRMKEDIQRLTKKQETGQRDRHSSDDYKALQSRLHRVEKELKETEFELEDTKTRLSKCMGDKLTNNNPNIVDLSDMNRPSKLADRYKELYDNQWTDAYEVLEKSERDEEHIIKILLDVFVKTKQFCEDKTRTQMEATLKAVTRSDKVSVSDVPVTVLKYIKDCTKASSAGDVKKNFEEYKIYLQDGAFVFAKQALSTPDYLQECFEICWLMSIQDPPVVMSPLLKHGVAFKSSLYSAYTVSGNLIDFTVWPALLLHENGPTLTKGVAQGMKKK